MYDQLVVVRHIYISTIPVIIFGDFNIHFNDEHTSSKLRNMLNDYQIQQHLNSATHEHGNTLDLVITNQRDNLVSDVCVMDYAISDHYSVECTLNISIKKIKEDSFQLKRAVKHRDIGVFVNDIKVTNTYMEAYRSTVCQAII